MPMASIAPASRDTQVEWEHGFLAGGLVLADEMPTTLSHIIRGHLPVFKIERQLHQAEH